MGNDTIELRPATIEDADLLLEWRNDPETRKACHNTSVIQRENHISWLSKTLCNPSRKLFVCEENGIPVGTARTDFSDGVHTISCIVAPNARGRTVIKRMLALLASQIKEPIRAEVKALGTGRNKAAARVAAYAGMKLVRITDGILHFRREALK